MDAMRLTSSRSDAAQARYEMLIGRVSIPYATLLISLNDDVRSVERQLPYCFVALMNLQQKKHVTEPAPCHEPQHIPPSTPLLSPSSMDGALPDEEDKDDNASTSSLSADSMFSLESAETRATSFTNYSGFTQAQVEGARRSLVSILRDNEDLVPLYLSARVNPKIGAKSLRRKMRGIITTYAENLEDEASDHLQLSASRLVRAEASRVARCIASEDEKHLRDPVNRLLEDIDEEFQESPVEHTHYGELNAFCAFLRDGKAFSTLRAQIQAFCSPEITPSIDKCTTDSAPSTKAANNLMEHTWVSLQENAQSIGSSILLGINSELLAKAFLLLLVDAIFLVTDDLLMTLGFLEPPLEVGWTRIRCQCFCGKRYFDDVMEICEGGIQALIRNIQHSLADTTINAVSYNERTKVQQYTGRFSTWIKVVYQRIADVLSWRYRRPIGLPHHNARNAASTTPIAAGGQSPRQQQPPKHQSTFDLMSCVHSSGEDIVLLQHDLRGIGNDLSLFDLLKQKILLRRNRILLALSCRSIQGIYFSKVSQHQPPQKK
ncbi:hypothetical protein DDE82_001577 [Stemphylium lycopersici]|nr:hypothetical protein TW65_03469 [Stemphylium lycopersici]RAR09860.1 hypothetical protein DDE82_001577 [Stemphylium lycopersici]